jgi:hypothetical protein
LIINAAAGMLKQGIAWVTSTIDAFGRSLNIAAFMEATEKSAMPMSVVNVIIGIILIGIYFNLMLVKRNTYYLATIRVETY